MEYFQRGKSKRLISLIEKIPEGMPFNPKKFQNKTHYNQMTPYNIDVVKKIIDLSDIFYSVTIKKSTYILSAEDAIYFKRLYSGIAEILKNNSTTKGYPFKNKAFSLDELISQYSLNSEIKKLLPDLIKQKSLNASTHKILWENLYLKNINNTQLTKSLAVSL